MVSQRVFKSICMYIYIYVYLSQLKKKNMSQTTELQWTWLPPFWQSLQRLFPKATFHNSYQHLSPFSAQESRYSHQPRKFVWRCQWFDNHNPTKPTLLSLWECSSRSTCSLVFLSGNPSFFPIQNQNLAYYSEMCVWDLFMVNKRIDRSWRLKWNMTFGRGWALGGQWHHAWIAVQQNPKKAP